MIKKKRSLLLTSRLRKSVVHSLISVCRNRMQGRLFYVSACMCVCTWVHIERHAMRKLFFIELHTYLCHSRQWKTLSSAAFLSFYLKYKEINVTICHNCKCKDVKA
uniref:Uncharacterized protein n=1 Tax=Octopus bimaculoides TaxID=37653 RepID=A0A0L8GGU5_OCTBM